jgi:uncharacterized membrane-anchored protein
VLVAISGGSPADTPAEWVVGVIAAVFLLALVISLLFLAERSLRRHRGRGPKRERSERNAMSRVLVRMARWPGSGGGG